MQDWLIQRLTEALSDRPVHVVRLNGRTTDILDEVLGQLPAPKPAGPVMVADWGNALKVGETGSPLVASLNVSRPKWPDTLPVPVVLWVPEDVLGILLREAPDFLDWRSDTCRFPDAPPKGPLSLEPMIADGLFGRTLSVEESRQRIKELEVRLAATEDHNDLVARCAQIDWLIDLGYHLTALGRYEDALSAFERAQARADPDACSPEQASRILNDSAYALKRLGRREEAFENVDKAVTIRRALAEERPEAFRPNLATSLSNQAATLRDLGRREEALESAREAVMIERALAKRGSDPFLRRLVGSLNNLAASFGDLGRREEALEACREAVMIGRGLAEGPSEAFLPGLGMSLNNLAIALCDSGRREEALEAAEEAAAIYRALAERRPSLFLSDLAMSLSNVATKLEELGRREEALEKAQEATRIYRGLAEERPDAVLPDLAMSLTNLAAILHALGWREEALENAQEAVRIYVGFAERQSDTFLPEVARSLGVLAHCHSALGQHAGARAKMEEGMRALLPLFQKHPLAFCRLIGAILADYRTFSRHAGVPPDKDLLRPIVDKLDELERSGAAR